MSVTRKNFNDFILELTIKPHTLKFEDIDELKTKTFTLMQILGKLFNVEIIKGKYLRTEVYVIDLLSSFLVFLDIVQYPLKNGERRKTIFDSKTIEIETNEGKSNIRSFVKQQMNLDDLIFVTSTVVYQLCKFRDSCNNKEDLFWSLWDDRRNLEVYDKIMNQISINIEVLKKGGWKDLYQDLYNLNSLLHTLNFIPKFNFYIERVLKNYISIVLSVEKEISSGEELRIERRREILKRRKYNSEQYLSFLKKSLIITHALAYFSYVHKSLSYIVKRNKDNSYIDYEDCGDDGAKLKSVLGKTVETLYEIYGFIETTDFMCIITTKNKAEVLRDNKYLSTKTEDLKNLISSLDFSVDIIEVYLLDIPRYIFTEMREVFY